MTKNGIIGLCLGLLGLAFSFAGSQFDSKAQTESLMAELEEKYVMVPRTEPDDD